MRRLLFAKSLKQKRDDNTLMIVIPFRQTLTSALFAEITIDVS